MINSTDTQLSFAGLSGGFQPDLESGPAISRAEHYLESLGSGLISERTETAHRIIREQSVTCHVTGGNGAEDRPWELDILPMLLSSEEWHVLESGVIQRARLLNHLLSDLYGMQLSLRNGWLPASLVYANPQFLRGCHGIAIHGGNRIPFYAVDLARSPDGIWRVLADRTQNPAGLGFALENRSILSQVLPEAMQTIQPRPLAGVLPLLRQSLAALSPQNQEQPTVVVLTPGPHNESYFEHTYLARMLGLTLVEGGDLTVRDRRVFIKTLEGLRPVDVILRRVHDAYCDPLEFRGDSLLGVPGLLEAMRTGHVTVGNALGSGLAETPALLPFLPGLCLQFLGEELLLPSLPTWWCGNAHALKHATLNTDSLAFRSAYSLQSEPQNGLQPPPDPAQLQESPHDWIAQEEAFLSTSRIFANQHFGAAPFVFRLFVISTGSKIQVIPGGLALLRPRRQQASSIIPLASPVKDLWVLPESDPVNETGSATPGPAPLLEQAPIEIPSRIADNLFWLGRYTERLENILRITRCVMGHATAPPGIISLQRLTLLHEMMLHLDLIPEDYRSSSSAEALLAVISEPAATGGVQELVSLIHQAAFAVRDRLSADTWRLLNRLKPDADPGTNTPGLLAASVMLDTLVLDLAAFSGMEMENMTRGHGWMFLQTGRRLERSLNLINLTAAALAFNDNTLLCEPLLEICDSVITHRRRHFGEIRLHSILELLLLDGDNPRSLAFQLNALELATVSLPEAPTPEGLAGIRRLASALSSILTATQIDPSAPEKSLSCPLREMQDLLRKISEMISLMYFSHVIPRIN